MIIKSANIKNILSIREMEFVVPATGMVLVDGWNQDQMSANGAGKSSIFHAMSWGIYGKFPRNVSISDFVSHGTKNSSVEVVIEVRDGELRCIRSKNPNTFKTYLNEVEIDEATFFKLLKIDYDQFILVSLFPQGLSERFIGLNDADRKDFLLKVVNSNFFSEIKEVADHKLDLVEKKLSLLNQELTVCINTKEVLQSNIVNESSILHNIEELTIQLSNISEELRNITKPTTEDISKVQALKSKLQDKLDSIRANRILTENLKRKLAEINSSKNPEDSFDFECPHCHSELDNINNSLVLHDKDSFLKKLEEFTIKKNKKIEDLKTQIIDLETTLSKEQDIYSTIQSLDTKIVNQKSIMQTFDETVKSLKLRKQFISGRISDNEGILLKNNDNLIKIENIQIQVEKTIKEIAALDSQKNRLIILTKATSPMGVPAYILDSVLAILNDKIKTNIEEVWPTISYQILSYKENKSGKVTAKFSDSITLNGEQTSIGSLSGGERACLSIMVDLALIDILESYVGETISPIVFDEPFAHLSEDNRERALDLIKSLSKNRVIILIDHSDDIKSRFDHIIKVVKRDGVSTLEN